MLWFIHELVLHQVTAVFMQVEVKRSFKLYHQNLARVIMKVVITYMAWEAHPSYLLQGWVANARGRWFGISIN